MTKNERKKKKKEEEKRVGYIFTKRTYQIAQKTKTEIRRKEIVGQLDHTCINPCLFPVQISFLSSSQNSAVTSSRASLTVLWTEEWPASPLLRGLIVSVGLLVEIFAMHFPVKMLLILIDPTAETAECQKRIRVKGSSQSYTINLRYKETMMGAHTKLQAISQTCYQLY